MKDKKQTKNHTYERERSGLI